MSEKTKGILNEMGIPETITEIVLKITQKEEEAVNLALQYLENPESIPNLEEQEVKKRGIRF